MKDSYARLGRQFDDVRGHVSGALEHCETVAARLRDAAAALEVIAGSAVSPDDNLLAIIIARAAVAVAIGQITKLGGIAVVVAADMTTDCAVLAQALGWDGKLPVFRLSRRKKAKYATQLREQGETARADWVGASLSRHERVLLVGLNGVHMLNRTSDGWVPAPGTDEYVR